MNFYTNVTTLGNKVLFRGIRDGKKSMRKLDYFPSLFVPSKGESEWKGIHGENLDKINPGDIRETRDFIQKYKDVDNFKIYGNTRFEYSWISENYAGPISWNRSYIDEINIDIEVASDNGYASPENPWQPIISITIRRNGKFIVWGLGEFTTDRSDVKYLRCSDETELLRSFINYWASDYPDVVTGWYIEGFDIPYIINRITQILGETEALRLSPWKKFTKKMVTIMGRENVNIKIMGISILDYIDLYKKFSKNGDSQESYRLDNIGFVELGEKKLDYSEYGNLNKLYKENHQKFIEYNIQDVALVDRLDGKLKLLELVYTMAYYAKVNFEDTFMQVRVWDILIFNELISKNVVIPPKKETIREDYIGGYVKTPQVGKHKWVVSFDLTSEYPMTEIQYNISPETLIEPENYTEDMRRILSMGVNIDSLLNESLNVTEILRKNNVTMTANGQFFRKDKEGFMGKMISDMFDLRSDYKKKMLSAQKKKEEEKDPNSRKDLEKEISKFDNLQSTFKVCLNAQYGALGNEHGRYYDVRLAAAVTTSGQLAIRWIAKDINLYLNKLLGTQDKDFVVASDTDSVYLSLDDLVTKVFGKDLPEDSKIIEFMDKVCSEKLQPFIDKSFERLGSYLNVFKQKMVMKREALCSVGIWTAKKRYILNVYNQEGVAYKEPKLKISGMEGIKSSTPTICRAKIKEAYKIAVSGTEEQMMDFIKDFKSEFSKAPLQDISFPRSMNGLKEYGDDKLVYTKGTPIHTKGALVFNEELKKRKLSNYEKIKDGEKIKFIYLKEPNPFHVNVISFMNLIPKEFDIEEWIDYNLQFNKSFLEPVKMVLDVIGWQTEKRKSLKDFMKK